jgi:hypothetical protein
MIRAFLLSLTAILFIASGSASGKLSTSEEIPTAATVEIVLQASGLNDKGSQWEIAYELRIINQAADWEAWKQGKFKAGSQERVGELLKAGSVRETLRSQAGRQVVLKIPFSPEIRKRLRNQPRESFKITPGRITPEEIKLLKEQEMRSQIFLFYSVINIYNAKLKKNIPVSRTWTFADYPDARFEIKVQINDDGSYTVKSALPKNAKGRQLEIRQ